MYGSGIPPIIYPSLCLPSANITNTALSTSGVGNHIPYDFDVPLDPLQKERQAMLKKQAFVAREKYGIRFEDTFTQEGMEGKYAPESIDDL